MIELHQVAKRNSLTQMSLEELRKGFLNVHIFAKISQNGYAEMAEDVQRILMSRVLKDREIGIRTSDIIRIANYVLEQKCLKSFSFCEIMFVECIVDSSEAIESYFEELASAEAKNTPQWKLDKNVNINWRLYRNLLMDFRRCAWDTQKNNRCIKDFAHFMLIDRSIRRALHFEQLTASNENIRREITSLLQWKNQDMVEQVESKVD
jgi:hypothetical protein